MGRYAYKGIISQSGASTKGRIEADSVKDAKGKLRKQGILAVDVKEVGNSKKIEKKTNILNDMFGSVPLTQIAIMTKQFATLQRAGIPLDESMLALSGQVEHEKFKTILAQIKQEISQGASLSKAMSMHPKVFDELYTSMIDAGEHSGALDVVLERLAEFTENSVKLKNTLVGAMMYPIIMIGASFLIIAYLFTSVLPKIIKMLESFKVPLPTATKLTIWLSNFLQNHWLLIGLGTVGAFFAFSYWIATPKGKWLWHTFLLKAPILSDINRKVSVSRFCSTLSTLISSGVPMNQALDIVKNVVTNVVIRKTVVDAKTRVVEGQSLAKALEESGHFPPMVVHMIKTGEATGDIESMLAHVAVAYDNEVHHKIGSLTSILAPIMLVLMAGIIALVIVSMLIPMFEIFNSVN